MVSDAGKREDQTGQPEALADVLASIRDLVSAEVKARRDAPAESDDGVLMLTPQMRVAASDAAARSGEILANGLDDAPARLAGAPLLDEEALRGVINTIVREELQGELGDRISRNLRKLIRQELSQIAAEKVKE